MLRTNYSRWLLPVSLSLNMFLAVAFASNFFFRSFGPPKPDKIAEEIAATLPKADGDILRQAFAAHASHFGKGPSAPHQMHDKIRAVLSAPVFDANALHEVFTENVKERASMDAVLETILTEAVARMSYEGRLKLAQWQPPHPPGR